MIKIRDINLIGIHGPLNGGKDTAANYLQAKFPDKFRRYAFASPIKQALSTLFGFTSLQMEDRVLKEKVDDFWGFAPRKAAQLLGTEYGRQLLREDVWIKRAEMEHQSNLKNGHGTIVTDVRFENEAEWIRSIEGSVLIYLDVLGIERDEKYNHASEAGISLKQSDVLIINDKSKGLDHFFKQLDHVFV